jgi:hypothetical protein
MRFLSCLALIVLPVVLACAQDAPLTKEQVIQMSKAGLSDDIIIAKIKSEPAPMKLSTDDLILLKTSGVSDAVIRALIAPPEPAAAPAEPAAAPAPEANPAPNDPEPDPNNPDSPHDPGIYLLTVPREGGRKMILIDRAGAGHEKTANTWGHAFSYGIAKAKVKAELPGPHAAVRAAEAKPEFYMYFPPTGSLGAADTISSPSQFSLLSLEEKKDHRETAILKIGFGTASSGTDEKRLFTFTAEKVRPYVYHVVPDADLKEGEYAFVASTGVGGTAAASSVVLYDFGVDLK